MAGKKDLLENIELSEDVKKVIKKSWDKQLALVKQELREEFAAKYDHDKTRLVETSAEWIDKQLGNQVNTIAEERSSIAKDRVKFQTSIKAYDKFIVEQLTKEVREFRKEREKLKESLNKFGDFIQKCIITELDEFSEDRKNLVETQIKTVRDNKRNLARTKRKFFEQASKKVEMFVNKSLQKQMSELKEDIVKANENDFGRKIFEAFASEYAITHMTEGKDYRELQATNDKLKDTVEAAKKIVAAQKSTVSDMAGKLKEADERNYRRDKIDKMLKPFSEENREIMEGLLENVKTERLDESFRRYMPSVVKRSTRNTIKGKGSPKNEQQKTMIREHTGDRRDIRESAESYTEDYNNDDNIIPMERLRELAGLKK